MKAQFQAREIAVERDPFVAEILKGHAEMVNRYDPASLFTKYGRLLGFRRYTSTERTDFSHFLLNSDWITSGIFAVDPSLEQAPNVAGSQQASDGSAFLRHSLWPTAGVFSLQI